MRNDLQKYFNKFYEEIKLIDTDDNKVLRDKRDMLVKELKDFFTKKSKEDNKSLITFSTENQGSYSMGTGVRCEKSYYFQKVPPPFLALQL